MAPKRKAWGSRTPKARRDETRRRTAYRDLDRWLRGWREFVRDPTDLAECLLKRLTDGEKRAVLTLLCREGVPCMHRDFLSTLGGNPEWRMRRLSAALVLTCKQLEVTRVAADGLGIPFAKHVWRQLHDGVDTVSKLGRPTKVDDEKVFSSVRTELQRHSADTSQVMKHQGAYVMKRNLVRSRAIARSNGFRV
jgi:hypothetical protein